MDLDRVRRSALSRRRFLLAALGVSGAGLLAACQPAAQPAPTAAPPKPTTPPAPPKPTAAASPVAKPAASPVASPAAGASPSPAAFSLNNPPPVPNAADAKKYSGAKITYYGDAVGIGNDLDKAAAQRFQQDTGIQVNVVPRPQDATDSLAQFLRFFQGQSPDLDVLMIDVIWPGQLAPHLVDLSQKLGTEAKQHYPGIVENNTINGKLVGIPWFGDFGMLFYRTDLVTKYGFSGPPKTWDELQQQAQKIVDGEKASNPNFVGFVFQGKAYEGLTCDALEWLASSGGGQIIENGKVTVNNPQAVAILNKARGWVGTIAPRGVTGYQEEDARNAFQSGGAAFMRNWPYAYSLGGKPDSAVKGKFDVAPLPAQPGNKPVGTVGGWQLAVSRYSKSQDAAIELVRYLASPQVETWRGVVGSFVPTIPSVAENPAVQQAQPYLKNLASVVRVTRPSRETGDKYNQASTIFFQGVNQILNGQDAAQILPGVQQQLERLIR